MNQAIPQYPAFQKSVVLESSFGGRKKLVSSLKGANLFMHIVEAESYRHGVELVSDGGTDACVIGSTVSVEKAADFIKLGRHLSSGNSCAFIAVIRGEEVDSKERSSLLYEAGAHRVVTTSCSKRVFCREVINAVHEDFVQAELRKSNTLSKLLGRAAEALHEAAYDLARSRLGLEGHLSDSTAPQARVLHALAAFRTEEEATREEDVFLEALAQWLLKRCTLSPEQALEEFRSELISALTH